MDIHIYMHIHIYLYILYIYIYIYIYKYIYIYIMRNVSQGKTASASFINTWSLMSLLDNH